MARATRSSATTSTAPEKDKPADPPPASRKATSRKRKRTTNVDNGDSPPTKHARTESKDEGSPQPQLEQEPEDKKDVDLRSSGDVPIHSEDAQNILDVLELADTQGLLDRVFPLPTTESGEAASADSSSNPPATMLSFRTLLQNSSQYPLRVLRAAVKHLYPISFHPRSRSSEPAAQQLRFCTLAISLLNQASQKNVPVPLAAESVIPGGEAQEVEDAAILSQSSSSDLRPRKYALVQHLPTGDWWTSVSSTPPVADGEEKDLKSLPTAKAELVAIFPSPSRPDLASKHTLGDYATKKPPGAARYKPAPPRRVSCGKFLYYGPYASFAPCFDQDGVEVGRVAMGEVIFQQEMRRRLRALAKGKRRAFIGADDAETEDAAMQDAVSGESATATAGPSGKPTDIAKGIEALLPPDEVEAIKVSLGTLEMEQAVDELLQRNARALQRLEELQLARLREQGEGSSIVEVGSEEWDVAQGIIDSLALLASLRPRPSNGDPDASPLVPPPSVLHKLQRTLPISATEGWYGTLPEGRTTAFRDDTTVHIRSSAVATVVSSRGAPTAAVTASTAIPSTPAAKTASGPSTAAVPPYTPYAYPSNYQSSQYRGGYGTYTPAQGGSGSGVGGAGSYFASYAQPATAAQGGGAAHYPSGYTYSPWYGYQGQAGTTTSGRATPQPGAAAAATPIATPTTTAQQRAVANTVLSSTKPYPAPAWGGPAAGGGYAAPTLPPHMRGAATPGGPPLLPQRELRVRVGMRGITAGTRRHGERYVALCSSSEL
ncbi:hypothetical protein BD414DRAFT_418392 [Trametes punicea]|nr:hypothetical protein BD414DRAFT_418392 [Trametes punicea]